MKAALIIPCRNEEATIAAAVREVREHFRGEVIVVDNNSSDGTAAAAAGAGARVVSEPTAGYGRACNAGAVAAQAGTEVFVFMDGDGSDRPQDFPALLAAIESGADLALGRRVGRDVEPGAIAPAARFGNWLSVTLIRLLWGARVHDLSPLKAIRASAINSLGMREATYGWTVEMIARAVARGLDIKEVDVGYRRRRGGESKVSGNLRASAVAGYRILATIARVRLHTLSWGARGAIFGAGIGLVMLALFTWWLFAQAPAGPKVLVAPWLLAWPLLLTCIIAGYALGEAARRLAVHLSVRNETTTGRHHERKADGTTPHPGR